MKNKKTILTIGILLVILIATILVIYSRPTSGPDSQNSFSLRDFLPFGNPQNGGDIEAPIIPTGNTNTNSTSTPTTIDKPLVKLRKLSSGPVSGAVVWTTGTTSMVRFVEKGTGNVYEAKSNSSTIKRITNTTIPKVIRSIWLPDGSGFIAQTLGDESEMIETSLVKLKKNNADSSLESGIEYIATISKLPTDIKELTISPDGKKIFYYTTDSNFSKWYIANPDGTGSRLVRTEYLKEWTPKWVSSNQILIYMKGSGYINTQSYVFNPNTLNLTKNTGGTGLATLLKGDGSLLLRSIGGDFPTNQIINTNNKRTTNININTFAEKCVWENKDVKLICAEPKNISRSTYPDVWYKGTLSTDDHIREVDINNNLYYSNTDLSKESGEFIDVVDPSLSKDDNYLIFRNKIDGFLWILNLRS